ncbi:MAG: EamA family transporter [Actinomycetota bacterium]
MTNLLAGLASLLWGTSDFFGGIAVRGRSAVRFGALTQPIGLAVVAIVVAFVPADPSKTDIRWGLAAGIATATSLVTLYRSLAIGPMYVAAPTAAVGGCAVPVVIGLISGERPGTVALVGVLLGITAVVLVGIQPEERERRGGHIRNVLALSAAAGVAIGTAVACFAQTSPESGVWPFVAAKLMAALILGSIALFSRQVDASAPGRNPWLVPAVGIGDAAATMLMLLALQRGSLVLVSVLGGLFPVVTVVLARALLDQRLTRTQLVGLAVAFLAVVMMTV